MPVGYYLLQEPVIVIRSHFGDLQHPVAEDVFSQSGHTRWNMDANLAVPIHGYSGYAGKQSARRTRSANYSTVLARLQSMPIANWRQPMAHDASCELPGSGTLEGRTKGALASVPQSKEWRAAIVILPSLASDRQGLEDQRTLLKASGLVAVKSEESG